MSFWKKTFPLKKAPLTRIFFPAGTAIERHRLENFPSRQLEREVCVDIFLPPGYFRSSQPDYPLLLFNDGQDLEAVRLAPTLARLFRREKIREIVAVGIHAGDRMQEYGTAHQPDYQNRGSKAAAYSRFVRKELLPALFRRYRLRLAPAQTTVAGFSLGGLSALDLAWNNPDLFGRAGVFSGALWWRSRPFIPDRPDADRIMHDLVRAGPRRSGLKFWLQTGTLDEKEDRNQNGIIDSIDDTLDLVAELENLGYQQERDIRYVEVVGGKHHPDTWARVMPDFLQWAYGRG